MMLAVLQTRNYKSFLDFEYSDFRTSTLLPIKHVKMYSDSTEI